MHEHRKLNLNIRKPIFAVRVVDHWIRLPREAVESASMEILKPRLDTVLGSLLWLALPELLLDDPANLKASVIL